ncbi:MAG: hypothetical protein P1V97_39315, partial [Planctomycetota bacterium]|nr:hypothetical protein [Planctomycetota bacterium]
NEDYPPKNRTVEHAQWRLIKDDIRREWQRRESSGDQQLLVDGYNEYFRKRPFVPELDPWPLTPSLLRALLSAELGTNKSGPKALLYSLLLHELDPKATLPSSFPVTPQGQVLRSAIEPALKNIHSSAEAEWKLLLLFSRYGLFLEAGTSERLSHYKGLEFFEAYTKSNENDPFLRFWRGCPREDPALTTELSELKKKLRKTQAPDFVNAGRSLWKQLERQESDLLYSLQSGNLGAQHHALATERLCRLWRHKLELKAEPSPEQLRERGVKMLESVLRDHPNPQSLLGFILEFETVGRPMASVKDKVVSLLAERRRHLEKWKNTARRRAEGEVVPFRKEKVTFDLVNYGKKINEMCYLEAILYGELEDVERGLGLLKKAVRTRYHHFLFLNFFLTIKPRKDLREYSEVLKILRSAKERIKENGAEEVKRSVDLLKEISSEIQKMQK